MSSTINHTNTQIKAFRRNLIAIATLIQPRLRTESFRSPVCFIIDAQPTYFLFAVISDPSNNIRDRNCLFTRIIPAGLTPQYLGIVDLVFLLSAAGIANHPLGHHPSQ